MHNRTDLFAYINNYEQARLWFVLVPLGGNNILEPRPQNKILIRASPSLLYRSTLRWGGGGVSNARHCSLFILVCRTGTIFLRFQASGSEREVSAERESRATDWTLNKSCPNPVARDSLSALASCFALAFALTCKTQKYNACSAGYVHLRLPSIYFTTD